MNSRCSHNTLCQDVHKYAATPSLDDTKIRTDQSLGRLLIAVGIATVGRPAVLVQMLKRLRMQTRAPDAIIVCAPNSADVEGVAEAFSEAIILPGSRGLPHQRNVILRHVSAFDVVVFFDDDFVPCRHYLENVEKIMIRHPDVVVTTGNVLIDGIRGPGLTFEAADSELQHCCSPSDVNCSLEEVFNGYGCNMSLRLAPARAHGLAFDETLPLYAWLEDVDLSRQFAPFGRVVKSEATRGVHLGIKSGRQSGVRLGYSQIANPVYLIRKGTYTWRRGFYLIGRNVAANLIRSFWPETWVDRRGRLSGNIRAILDLVAGRLDPARVLFW